MIHTGDYPNQPQPAVFGSPNWVLLSFTALVAMVARHTDVALRSSEEFEEPKHNVKERFVPRLAIV